MPDKRQIIGILFLLGAVFIATIIGGREESEKGVLEEPFSLSVGESETIENLSMTLVEVVEDSRCPADAICVWEGTIGVKLKLSVGQKNSQITFTKHDGPQVFAGYSVEIVSAEPKPVSTKEISQEEYIVTFVVNKVASIGIW